MTWNVARSVASAARLGVRILLYDRSGPLVIPVVQHPDRRAGGGGEGDAAAHAEQVVTPHHGPDPFAREQALDEVRIERVVGEVDGAHHPLCRYRTAVRASRSAPITSASSSMSNVGLWCGEAFAPGGAEPTKANAPGTRARKKDMSSPPMVRTPSTTRSFPTISSATPFMSSVIRSSFPVGWHSRRYRTSARAPKAPAIPRAVSSTSAGASS